MKANWRLILTLGLFLYFVSGPAWAENVNWTGLENDNLWSSINNWSPQAPSDGDEVIIYGAEVYYDQLIGTVLNLNIDAAQFYHEANTLTVTNNLFVNGADQGAAAYYLSDSSNLIKSANEVIIGTTGYGLFQQGGGTFELNGAMYLGDQSGSVGTYSMNDGQLFAGASGAEIVLGEWGGTGYFNHSGGSVTVNDLVLGRQVEGTGNYFLQGQFTAPGSTDWPGAGEEIEDLAAAFLGVTDGLTVGKAGTGSFIQEGGIAVVKNDLVLGQDGARTDNNGNEIKRASGTYSLIDGVLWTGNTVVGDYGYGLFTQESGMHFVGVDPSTPDFPFIDDGQPHTLFVGRDAGSEGYYAMSGGQLYVAREKIGSVGANWAQFSQSGGEHHVYGDLFVGDEAYAGFILNSHAVLNVGGDATIGRNGGSGSLALAGESVVNIDGSLTVASYTSSSQTTQGYVYHGFDRPDSPVASTASLKAGSLVLGMDPDTVGEYRLNSGTLQTGSTIVGDDGSGGFIQTGGSHATQTLKLGDKELSTGIYRLEGGELTVDHEVIGGKGSGVFKQTAGTHTVTNLTLGSTKSAYNMLGGTLVTDNVSNQGYFNYNGGNLQINHLFDNNFVFEGTGTISSPGQSFVFNNGVGGYGYFRPGGENIAGSLNIQGSYHQSNFAQMDIDLGGLDSNLFDFVNITGDAFLDGYLSVNVLEGFSLKSGDTFKILEAADIVGEFASILGPSNWLWTASILPVMGENDVVVSKYVLLTASSVPIPGAALLLGSGLLGLLGLRRRQLR